MSRHRMYALLSVLTMTLAVGANLIVFSIINALWLRPHPVADLDRVVVVARRGEPLDAARFSDLGLTRLRSLGLFEEVAGQVVTRDLFAALQPRVVLEAVGTTVETLGVTPEYFPLLGLAPFGRNFTAADDRYGELPVAIISDRLWKSRFGGRSDVLGATVPASPQPVTIIGVAPPKFHGALRGEDVDLWLPHHLLPQLNGLPRDGFLPMLDICRLADGVSLGNVRTSFARSDRPSDHNVDVLPLARFFGAPDRSTIVIREESLLTLLAVTAVLVLAGGCATLMALVVVHYERRRREIAIRQALGADRSRLARQLGLELAVLVVLGTGGALLITWAGVPLLPHVRMPDGLDLGRVDLSVDWRVSAVAVLACIAAMTFAAAFPLVRFTRADLVTSLATGQATSARSSIFLRRAVLAVQAAATTAVLLGAVMFVRTVGDGFAQGAGFDVARTLFLTVQTQPRTGGTTDDTAARAARDLAASRTLLDQLGALPGIEIVALGGAPIGPLVERTLSTPQVIRTDSGEIELPVGWLDGGPDYLEALGVRILSGRAGGRGEIAVTASLASQLWPSESPIGHRLSMGPVEGEVTGVVDISYGSLRFGRPAAFITFDQAFALPLIIQNNHQFSFTIRTANPQSIREPIRRLVSESFPDAPFTDVTTGVDLVTTDLGRERLGAWFFSGFGLVALLLGIGSVFGLVAYLVDASRREFGVMVALGARHRDVMVLAVRRGLVPVAFGAAFGTLAAFFFARSLRSVVFGLHDVDIPACAAVFTLFVGCAAAAGVLAALPLRRIAPMDALRAE